MTNEEKASLLSGGDVWNTRKVKRLGIPSISMADGPTGIRKQAVSSDHLGLHPSIPSTCFPTAATVANSWDVELAKELGNYLGGEAASLGVDVVLGPGLNIKRSPLCGRNFEYFSEDPYLSGKLAASYCKGLNTAGVTGCVKHFVANEQELRRMSNDSVVDMRALREIYLTGFEIAVKEGKPLSLMTAYNKVNGTYANENKFLLQDILRDEWGFDGFVVSDWGGGNDHVAGVVAGSHLEMPGTQYNSPIEIIRALEEGRMNENILDQRVDELLSAVLQIQKRKRAKNNPGIKDTDKTTKELTLDQESKPSKESNSKKKYETLQRQFNIKNHHSFAIKAARESVVMLKNEEHILPISSDRKVAIIGAFAKKPRFQGSGSSQVNPTRIDNTLEHVTDYDINFIGYAPGFDLVPDSKGSLSKIKEATALAKKADIVLLYLGLEEVRETEGLDRDCMELSKSQVGLLEALHAVHSNIVIVLSCGSPIEMPWINQCKGLLHGYLGGQGGARAILDILVGKANPSGKLAETYPISLEDTPCYNYYPGLEKTAPYLEGIYIGYRYYDKANIPVRFPFGYGLSYTTFSYSNIKVDQEKVQFTLKNTGDVAGAEIAQLYIGKGVSDIYRSKKELKGFKKVFLEPGEEQQVTIPFDDYTFRYFSVSENEFKIEEGTYQVYIGANVADIRLTAWIDREGDKTSSELTQGFIPTYFSGRVNNVSKEEFEIILGRPLPESKWDRNAPLGINDTLSQGFYCKGFVGRFIYKKILAKRKQALSGERADINLLVVFEMPFRAFAKLTGGRVDMHMARGILAIFNGHTFAGASHVKLSFIKMKIGNFIFKLKLKYPHGILKHKISKKGYSE